MSSLEFVINYVVIGNRILAREGVLDAFGHISHRHPTNQNRYLLLRSRSPELVTHADVLRSELNGTPVAAGGWRPEPYAECCIDDAIYDRFPAINSAVHNRAPSALPFTISSVKLRALNHVASRCGCEVPVWDIRTKFGDTKLLVTNMAQVRDRAETLSLGDGGGLLIREHGFAAAGQTIQDVVKTSVVLAVKREGAGRGDPSERRGVLPVPGRGGGAGDQFDRA